MGYYFGQSTATKLTLADTYFGVSNHIRHFDWNEYTDDERTAAIIQAERELDAHLGLVLEDEYSSTSFPIAAAPSFRPDYAVFEHGFYLLENTARTRTASGGAEMIESEGYQEAEKTVGVGIAPEALVFLRVNRIQIERG